MIGPEKSDPFRRTLFQKGSAVASSEPILRRCTPLSLLLLPIAWLLAGCSPSAPATFEEVAAAPPDHSSPTGIVRSYLTRIGTGRLAEAYDLTSPDSQAAVSLEEFVDPHAKLFSHAVLERFDIERTVEETPDRVQVWIRYTLLFHGNERNELQKVYVAVRDKGGAWWVVFPSPQPDELKRKSPASDPADSSAPPPEHAPASKGAGA